MKNFGNDLSDYTNLVKQLNNGGNGIAQNESYKASLYTDSTFILVQDDKGGFKADRGIKLHVSVDPNRIQDAWKIIMEVMTKHHVREIKFANPLYIDNPNQIQEGGREIAFYTHNDTGRRLYELQNELKPSKDLLDKNIMYPLGDLKMDLPSWELIICDLTQRLKEAGIQPGVVPEGNSTGGGYEHKIKGTDYVTWRNDLLYMESFKLKDEYKDSVIPLDVTNDEILNKYIVDPGVDYDEMGFKYYCGLLRGFAHISQSLLQNELLMNHIEQLPNLSKKDHEDRREENYNNLRSFLNIENDNEHNINMTSKIDLPPPPPSLNSKPPLNEREYTKRSQPLSQKYDQQQITTSNGLPPPPPSKNKPPLHEREYIKRQKPPYSGNENTQNNFIDAHPNITKNDDKFNEFVNRLNTITQQNLEKISKSQPRRNNSNDTQNIENETIKQGITKNTGTNLKNG